VDVEKIKRCVCKVCGRFLTGVEHIAYPLSEKEINYGTSWYCDHSDCELYRKYVDVMPVDFEQLKEAVQEIFGRSDIVKVIHIGKYMFGAHEYILYFSDKSSKRYRIRQRA